MPFLGDELATTIAPHIYLPEAMYANMLSGAPDNQNIAVVIHESEHLARQAEYPAGEAAWKWKYLTSKSFRLGEELTAIRVEMKYRKQQGLEYDKERKARQFSSGIYLWAASYEQSLDILREMWNHTTI